MKKNDNNKQNFKEFKGWKVSNKLKALQEKFLDKEEITEDDLQLFQDSFDSLKETLGTDLDDIANWILNNKLEEAKYNGIKAFYADQATAARKRANGLDKLNKNLNKYITALVDNAGVKQIETAQRIYRPKKHKDIVWLIDEENIDYLPKEFIKENVKYAPDKTKIYRALKDGQEIEGAKLLPNRTTQII
ncbi:siphovirus Gp157 family protein [Lactobacillus jensenii]|jgi:gp157|uniref:siphovirus Gp157 family protein n=1 Tax=Lactobacillus jensenii TaxID=109790 RepID=UPI000398D819|nr:siphovirus Gp157 family protein [Lactobacillus jensenii]ERJ44147.1 hypothetical protein N581_07940 [Lactobacillus jensenii MD IIE-70(2)]MCF1843630.1 siphovirus Gp157 family protein [Lactobacillus jensenii]TVV06207.1 hypothetical protein FOF79_00255 [Lactobacillus jensenii]DAQ86103.1 MAG TPA: resistance protein [Caudoviricetes sp.]